MSDWQGGNYSSGWGVRILDRDAFSVAKTQQPTVTVKKERQKFVF